MNLRSALTATMVTALGLNAALGQTPLGTGFSYQGQLKQNGQPYTGLADLVFRLFDAATGGTLLGTQTLNSVNISGGLFTVLLNAGGEFGGDAFNGDSRWLEATVNGTLLTPRQPLTPAPYSLFSSAPWVTLGNDISYTLGSVGIGTTTPENTLHVFKGSAGGITGNPNAPLIVENSTNTYINLLSPDAHERGILFGQPTGGTAAGGVIYNNPSDPNGLQFRTNGNVNRMVITSIGAVGIGTTTPAATLHVFDPSVATLRLERSGATQVQIAAQSSIGRIGTLNAFPLRFTTGGNDQVTIDTGGNVGVGTTTPAALLDVNGTANVQDLTVTGAITHAFAPGATPERMHPIAYGAISSDGTILSGTHNFTAALVTGGDLRYTIAIVGEAYSFITYAAIITPIGLSPVSVATFSESGALAIRMFGGGGTRTQQDFGFVVYKQSF